MKIVFLLIMIIPLLGFSQHNKKKIKETYLYSDRLFFYKLNLFDDSTFYYEHSFKLGTTKSEGKWKIQNDLLILSDFETPIKIKEVQEWKINTSDTIVQVKIVSADSGNIVSGFQVWINDDCSAQTLTDKEGIARFKTSSVNQISIPWNNYKTLCDSNNFYHITVCLDQILASPPDLSWTKWIIEGDKICPLECGQSLTYICLIKKYYSGWLKHKSGKPRHK